MLALFSKRQKKGAEPETPKTDAEALSEEDVVEQAERTAPQLDEETIRKNIAEKLRNYRPVEREANFSGPKFYKS